MTEISWDTNLSELEPEEIIDWVNNHRTESVEIGTPLYALHQTLIGWLMWKDVPENKRGFPLPNTLAELRDRPIRKKTGFDE